MDQRLKGRRIAALAADGFEKVELVVPMKALQAAGAQVDVISLRHGNIRGVNLHEPASRVHVDKTIAEANQTITKGCCCAGDSSILTCFASRRSWPGVRDDLVNAGATWLDQPFVRGGNLATSRDNHGKEQAPGKARKPQEWEGVGRDEKASRHEPRPWRARGRHAIPA